MTQAYSYIIPDWPVASQVKAISTLRTGGISQAPYDSMNLAQHVGDDKTVVAQNRALLNLPAEPLWLSQVHSAQVVDAAQAAVDSEADASFSRQAGVICCVMTADCLPLLVCNRAGTEVAAIHAGWRGMAAGIIEQTIHTLTSAPSELRVWLGPGIGADVYEVGDEVRNAFVQQHNQATLAFTPSASGKWLADMYQLAKQRLARLGVTEVYGGDYCTYSQADKFFSYRRDGVTGRMASMIWFESR